MTFTCSAVGLPSTTSRWFFNGNQFALYTISITDIYPQTVEPQNATYNTLIGGVNIQILEANVNEDNPDVANFLSTMTVHNISALLGAGISNLECGSFAVRKNISIPDVKNCKV